MCSEILTVCNQNAGYNCVCKLNHGCKSCCLKYKCSNAPERFTIPVMEMSPTGAVSFYTKSGASAPFRMVTNPDVVLSQGRHQLQSKDSSDVWYEPLLWLQQGLRHERAEPVSHKWYSGKDVLYLIYVRLTDQAVSCNPVTSNAEKDYFLKIFLLWAQHFK